MEAKVFINVNARWEKNIKHDKRSEEIMNFLADYDFNFCENYFDWKTGGDGDNGETLMYELDEFFANKKDLTKEKRCKN